MNGVFNHRIETAGGSVTVSGPEPSFLTQDARLSIATDAGRTSVPLTPADALALAVILRAVSGAADDTQPDTGTQRAEDQDGAAGAAEAAYDSRAIRLFALMRTLNTVAADAAELISSLYRDDVIRSEPLGRVAAVQRKIESLYESVDYPPRKFRQTEKERAELAARAVRDSLHLWDFRKLPRGAE